MPFIPDLKQITGFIPDIETPEQKITRFRGLTQMAEKEAQKPLFRRFLGALPGATTEVALKTPAKFAVSGITSPIDITRGIAGQEPISARLPFVGQTFQAEAAERLRQGATPLGTIGRAALEVPFTGLETLGVAKGIGQFPKLLKTTAGLAAKTVAPISEFLGKRAAKRGLEEAIDITKPVLGKRESILAIKKAGKPGGVIEKGRIFGRIERTPTKEEIEIAKTARPFVGNRTQVVKNAANLDDEVSRFSQQEIRPFLQQNPRAFNIQTFESHLKSVEAPDWIKAESVAEKTYELVKNRMIDAARKNKKTMEGLWDARKNFDDVVEEQFGEAIFDPNKRAFVNRAVRDMRHATNNFIGKEIGNETFKNSMKRLNRLYEARDNIGEQFYKLVNAGALKRFKALNPNIYRTVKAAGLGIGGYIGYRLLGRLTGD